MKKEKDTSPATLKKRQLRASSWELIKKRQQDELRPMVKLLKKKCDEQEDIHIRKMNW